MPSLHLDLQKPCCFHLLLIPWAWRDPVGGGASPLCPAPTSLPTQRRWVGPEMHPRDSIHLWFQCLSQSKQLPDSQLIS